MNTAKVVNVGIVGTKAVGKTLLCKRLTNQVDFDFEEECRNTGPTIFTNFLGNGLHFHEGGGNPLFKNIRKVVYRKQKLVCMLVCFSYDNKVSFQNISTIFMKEVLENTKDLPIVLLGLKYDLVASKREVEEKEVMDLLTKEVNFNRFLKISTKNGTGLDKLVKMFTKFSLTSNIKIPNIEKTEKKVEKRVLTPEEKEKRKQKRRSKRRSKKLKLESLQKDLKKDLKKEMEKEMKKDLKWKRRLSRDIAKDLHDLSPVVLNPTNVEAIFTTPENTPEKKAKPVKENVIENVEKIIKKIDEDSQKKEKKKKKSFYAGIKSKTLKFFSPQLKKRRTKESHEEPLPRSSSNLDIKKSLGKRSVTPSLNKRNFKNFSKDFKKRDFKKSSNYNTISFGKQKGGMKRSFSLINLKKRKTKQKKKEMTDLVDGFEIHYQAFYGNEKELKALIEQGRDINIFDKNGNTPLHYASLKNNIKCVRELIKCRDLNPNVYNLEGNTPLHIACEKGFHEIVGLLIRNGQCNKDIPNQDGKSPLFLALNSITSKALQLQKKNEEAFINIFENKTLYKSNKDLFIRKVNDLINEININCTNKNGENALDLAIQNGWSLSIIKKLVRKNVTIKKVILPFLKDGYKNFLIPKFNQKNRESIFLDLIKTEREYNDDMRLLSENILIHIENKKSINDIIGGDKKSMQHLNYVRVTQSLFNQIKQIRRTSTVFIKEVIKQVPHFDSSNDDILVKEEEILKSFKHLKLGFDVFLSFLRSLCVFNDYLENERKHFKELLKLIKVQIKKIPYPKDYDFITFLEKTKERLIYYQNFFKELKEKTHVNEPLYPLIEEYFNLFDENTNKKYRDSMVDGQSSVQLERVNKIFGKKYGDTSFVFKKNSNQFIGKKRKHVWHQLGLSGYNLKKRIPISKEMDIFIFSDCIVFGKKKKLFKYNYFDNRVVFKLNRDFIQISIFKLKGSVPKLVIDFIFKLTYDKNDNEEKKEFDLKSQNVVVKLGKDLMNAFRYKKGKTVYLFNKVIVILNYENNLNVIKNFIETSIFLNNPSQLKTNRLQLLKTEMSRVRRNQEVLEKEIKKLEEDIKKSEKKMEKKKKLI